MSESQLDHQDSIPFYPDHVRTEFKVVLGVLGVVVIFGILGLAAPLGLRRASRPVEHPHARQAGMVLPGSLPAAQIYPQDSRSGRPCYFRPAGSNLAFSRPQGRDH